MGQLPCSMQGKPKLKMEQAARQLELLFSMGWRNQTNWGLLWVWRTNLLRLSALAASHESVHFTCVDRLCDSATYHFACA